MRLARIETGSFDREKLDPVPFAAPAPKALKGDDEEDEEDDDKEGDEEEEEEPERDDEVAFEGGVRQRRGRMGKGTCDGSVMGYGSDKRLLEECCAGKERLRLKMKRGPSSF